MKESEIKSLLKESYRIFNELGEKGNHLPYDAEMDIFAAWGRLEWGKQVAINYLKEFVNENKNEKGNNYGN